MTIEHDTTGRIRPRTGPSTDGQRLAIRDALLTSAWTRDLVNTEEANHVARVATQALDKLAAEPPAVDPREGARRVGAHVAEALQPYRDELAKLDQHLEPTLGQKLTIAAIYDILRAARGLDLAMQAAAIQLTRAGITIRAEYRA